MVQRSTCRSLNVAKGHICHSENLHASSGMLENRNSAGRRCPHSSSRGGRVRPRDDTCRDGGSPVSVFMHARQGMEILAMTVWGAVAYGMVYCCRNADKFLRRYSEESHRTQREMLILTPSRQADPGRLNGRPGGPRRAFFQSGVGGPRPRRQAVTPVRKPRRCRLLLNQLADCYQILADTTGREDTKLLATPNRRDAKRCSTAQQRECWQLYEAWSARPHGRWCWDPVHAPGTRPPLGSGRCLERVPAEAEVEWHLSLQGRSSP